MSFTKNKIKNVFLKTSVIFMVAFFSSTLYAKVVKDDGGGGGVEMKDEISQEEFQNPGSISSIVTSGFRKLTNMVFSGTKSTASFYGFPKEISVEGNYEIVLGYPAWLGAEKVLAGSGNPDIVGMPNPFGPIADDQRRQKEILDRVKDREEKKRDVNLKDDNKLSKKAEEKIKKLKRKAKNADDPRNSRNVKNHQKEMNNPRDEEGNFEIDLSLKLESEDEQQLRESIYGKKGKEEMILEEKDYPKGISVDYGWEDSQRITSLEQLQAIAESGADNLYLIIHLFEFSNIDFKLFMQILLNLLQNNRIAGLAILSFLDEVFYKYLLDKIVDKGIVTNALKDIRIPIPFLDLESALVCFPGLERLYIKFEYIPGVTPINFGDHDNYVPISQYYDVSLLEQMLPNIQHLGVYIYPDRSCRFDLPTDSYSNLVTVPCESQRGYHFVLREFAEYFSGLKTLKISGRLNKRFWIRDNIEKREEILFPPQCVASFDEH